MSFNASKTTPSAYYNDSSLHGDYQYVALNEVIDNFILNYTGPDKIIKKIARHNVIFHAKRGLQELSFDILRDVKAVEFVVNPETLSFVLPPGYIGMVRISQVQDNGAFLPLVENHDTRIADNYLQDHQYNIIFGSDGYPLLDSENSYDPTKLPDNTRSDVRQYYYYEYYETNLGSGGLYWLDVARANVNPWYTIDERNGVIKFSSEISNSPTLVLEYISDGLNYADESSIVIHKYAVSTLYAYIELEILSSLDNVQEYVIRRKRNDFKAKFNNAAIRRMKLNPSELAQVMRGRQNWVK